MIWSQHLKMWEEVVGREGRSLRSRWIRRRKMERGGQDTGGGKIKDDQKRGKKQKMSSRWEQQEKEAEQDVSKHTKQGKDRAEGVKEQKRE